eukprot:534847-Lingulodinium_polyedra.AAC.1
MEGGLGEPPGPGAVSDNAKVIAREERHALRAPGMVQNVDGTGGGPGFGRACRDGGGKGHGVSEGASPGG